MEAGIYIEGALREVLEETDLVNFERKLCVELQLSRLDHFDHITDDELKSYTGISQPAIRRLRVAIAEKKKKMRKSKGIFHTIGKKESREVTKVLVPTSTNVDVLMSHAERNGTCLIVKEEIKLMERLGEGSFAVVKRALWKSKTGQNLDVAVKILRESTPQIIEDLQREVTNMQKLQHPNLIQLYGIVFSNPAMMGSVVTLPNSKEVVEFCDGGSLIGRLRSTEKPVILVSVLVDYAQQIAKGMAYLESKHCVHRDLAARNVLLTNNERVAKICDFGLMRALENNERLYVMSEQKKVPFAWCPPESLRYRQFSHASDVWSFGVTLWELFSYGEEPWVGLCGAEVLTKLEAGERLPRPQRCSNELYDLILACWSLKDDLRPKFTLLKGFLSEVMFMIAECREPSLYSDEVDLEFIVNDRIIIIHGSGSIWYGQNMRTGKFGSFFRSSVHLRSERSPTKGLSQLHLRSGDVTTISRPVPGSFIHAGHGDTNPEQSWGQPDYIDDIYLKNPILRNEINENRQKSVGPEIIPSLIDLQPPLLHFNRGQNNVLNDDKCVVAGSDSYIDPFTSFSLYSFDVESDNEPYRPDGLTKTLPSTLPSIIYDEPPSHTSCFANAMESTSSVSSLQLPSAAALPIPHCTAIDSRDEGPVNLYFTANSQNTINLQQFSSLPRPVRSIPDVPFSSQLHRSSYSGTDVSAKPSQNLATTHSVSALQLPSTSWECIQSPNLEQHATSQTNPSLHCTSNYMVVASGDCNVSTSDSQMQKIKKTPPPRPKPPILKPANTVTKTIPSTVTHTGIQASTSSDKYHHTDPFEVPEAVKDIANRGGYSQLFRESSLPAKTCYWQSDHAVPVQSALSSSYGNKPALLYNAQLGASSKLNSSMANGLSIRPQHFASVVNSSRQINSFLYDEVLCMFDPLVAERDVSKNFRIFASNVQDSDPLSIVLTKASFADRQRCARKLIGCENNIEKAVNELKIEELLLMGVARDRSQAVSALQDCKWDLNAAAAALIA